MATGQERQEPETFTQEVQEGKEAAGRHIHSIRIASSIDPEKAWLYDLNKDNFDKLTPEQQKEWIAHQQESIKHLPEAIERIKKSLSQIINIIHEGNRAAWEYSKIAISQAAGEIGELTDKMNKLEQIEQLEPFIVAELKKPEYKGLEIADLLEDLAGERKEPIPGELWEKILTAASGADKTLLPSVTMIRTDSVEYPVDKINSNIWYDLFKEDTGGQLCFAVQKKGAKEKIPIVYSIDFDALDEGMKITKKLTQFDKRVYIAISALFNEGNKVISLTQIHRTIGNEKRPSKEQLEKINNSITKMTGARITLDNSKEVKANYGYDKFIYDGSLLPLERGAAVVNGQLADAAIHIFREPPAMSFAKQRKQITTLDIKLLQSPLNKTESNLLIDDYLIERIARAKRGNGHDEKILYKTLYEKAGIKTAKQKQRTADKIKSYLEHYQKCGFITKYSIESDGIRAYF